MLQSLVVLFLLACSASAQSISFFFPGGYDGVDPVASIKSVNASATQFRIACPSGTNSNDCGWGPGVDYTIISKTSYKASISYDSSTMSLGCNYNSQATQMTCVANMKGASISSGLKTATLTGSDVVFVQASVVSGASLLDTTSTASMSMTTVAASGSRSTGSGPAATGPGGAAKTGAATRFGIETSTIFGLVGMAVLSVL